MVKHGDILGHEFMGIVEDAGPAVTRVKRGDRVVIPFVIACGSCYYCSLSLFSACETTNPQTGKLEGRGALLNKKNATDAFDKGLTFKMGQTHVQRFMPELLERIGEGALRPEAIITHRMKLADAEQGYKIFNEKEEDCRKVVLTP